MKNQLNSMQSISGSVSDFMREYIQLVFLQKKPYKNFFNKFAKDCQRRFIYQRLHEESINKRPLFLLREQDIHRDSLPINDDRRVQREDSEPSIEKHGLFLLVFRQEHQ